MSDSNKAEMEFFSEAGSPKKSSELAYLDRVAIIGFSFLGVASIVILVGLVYLSIG